MKQTTALCTLLLLLCLLPGTLRAQEAGEEDSDASKVEELLRELRITPPVERSKTRDKFKRFVGADLTRPEAQERRQLLVRRIRTELEKEATEVDRNYLLHLVLLLQRWGVRQEDYQLTNVLLKLLGSKDVALRYHTTNALGELWEDVGKRSNPPEKVKEVNTELLGLLSTDIETVEIYAIAEALSSINRVPPIMAVNPLTKRKEPVSWDAFTPKELQTKVLPHIEQWSRSEQGSQLLLPLDQRRPLDILKTMLKSTQEEEQRKARQILMKQRPLEIVEPLLERIPQAVKQKDFVLRDNLALLLSTITDVPLDLAAADTEGLALQQLQIWQRAWANRMADQKTERMRKYITQQLVDELTKQKQPNPLRIERLRLICLKNFDKPEDAKPLLPESIFKRLLEEPLTRKAEIARNVQTIAEAEQLGDRRLAINRIRTRLLLTAEDKKLALLFVPELVQIMKAERRRRIIFDLRELLRDITGYPMEPMEDLAQAQRNNVIDDWFREKIRPMLENWLRPARTEE